MKENMQSNTIKIIQSDSQSIISRAIDMLGGLGWYILLSILFGLIWSDSFKLRDVVITSAIVIAFFAFTTMLFALLVPKPYRQIHFA